MSLGDRIKLRRKQLRITQQDLADRIGTSQRQILKYEQGDNSPTAAVIAALATALETTSDWLIGLSDDIHPMGDESDLAPREQALLRLYRLKTPDQQETIINVVRAL